MFPKGFLQGPEGKVLPLAKYHKINVTEHRTHTQRLFKKEPYLFSLRFRLPDSKLVQ